MPGKSDEASRAGESEEICDACAASLDVHRVDRESMLGRVHERTECPELARAHRRRAQGRQRREIGNSGEVMGTRCRGGTLEYYLYVSSRRMCDVEVHGMQVSRGKDGDEEVSQDYRHVEEGEEMWTPALLARDAWRPSS